MEDMHASQSGKEEIIEGGDYRRLLYVDKFLDDKAMGGDYRSLLYSDAEKFVDDEVMGSQSPRTSITQDRVFPHDAYVKKPNKKPNNSLLCPRCLSFNTKESYYNNYSLMKPRYFCLNCLKYWTDEGLLKNKRMRANPDEDKGGLWKTVGLDKSPQESLAGKEDTLMLEAGTQTEEESSSPS